MKAALAGIAGLLLLANLGVMLWLISVSDATNKANRAVSGQVVMQVDKLWQKATEFQSAYEGVVATAQYPDEEKKKEHAESLRSAKLNFELIRINYLESRDKPTRRNVARFVESVGSGFYAPKFEDRDLQKDYSWKVVTYGNTARLDALNNDYWVLAQTLLKDVK